MQSNYLQYNSNGVSDISKDFTIKLYVWDNDKGPSFFMPRVHSSQLLFECNMPEDDAIQIGHWTYDVLLIWNGQAGRDGKIQWLRKKSSPRRLQTLGD